jgi:hypothetical protein
MAARTAVAEMHARLIADVSQYDAEMKRAAALTQQNAAKIEGQFEKLQRDIKRKFSAGEIGKDIMRGIGFGSGFAVAQTAAEQVVGYYREQAEISRDIEASVERQLALTKELISLKQTPEQRVDTLRKEREEMQKEINRYNDMDGRTVRLPMDMHGQSRTIVAALSPEQVRERQRITNAMTEIDLQIEKLETAERLLKIAEKERQQAHDSARSMAAKAAGLKLQEESFQKLLSTQAEATDQERKAREGREHELEQLRQLAEQYKNMADPMRSYRMEIEKVGKLELRGLLTMQEAAAARAQIIDASPAGQAFALNQQRFAPPDVDVKALTAETEALRQAAGDMGFAFSSAFEDAVLEGEKLSGVMRSLAQDVLRVFLRLGVTNPMINTLFGASGLNVGGFNPLPALFGGGKAAGGPVAEGTPYLVGERGPELFVPGGTGKIVPNHQLGEGRAVVVHVTNTFQSGVTRQEVAGLLPQLVDASKNAVLDAVNRGGAYRRGFAS